MRHFNLQSDHTVQLVGIYHSYHGLHYILHSGMKKNSEIQKFSRLPHIPIYSLLFSFKRQILNDSNFCQGTTNKQNVLDLPHLSGNLQIQTSFLPEQGWKDLHLAQFVQLVVFVCVICSLSLPTDLKYQHVKYF